MESNPAEGGQQLTWDVCETDWQAKVVKSALCAESAKYKLLQPVQTSDPPKHVRCLEKSCEYRTSRTKSPQRKPVSGSFGCCVPSLTLHMTVSLGTYHEHISVAQQAIPFIALLTNAAPNARGIGLTGGLREANGQHDLLS